MIRITSRHLKYLASPKGYSIRLCRGINPLYTINRKYNKSKESENDKQTSEQERNRKALEEAKELLRKEQERILKIEQEQLELEEDLKKNKKRRYKKRFLLILPFIIPAYYIYILLLEKKKEEDLKVTVSRIVEISASETELSDQLDDLKQQLSDKKISSEEYDEKSYDLTVALLEIAQEKRKLYLKLAAAKDYYYDMIHDAPDSNIALLNGLKSMDPKIVLFTSEIVNELSTFEKYANEMTTNGILRATFDVLLSDDSNPLIRKRCAEVIAHIASFESNHEKLLYYTEHLRQLCSKKDYQSHFAAGRVMLYMLSNPNIAPKVITSTTIEPQITTISFSRLLDILYSNTNNEEIEDMATIAMDLTRGKSADSVRNYLTNYEAKYLGKTFLNFIGFGAAYVTIRQTLRHLKPQHRIFFRTVPKRSLYGVLACSIYASLIIGQQFYQRRKRRYYGTNDDWIRKNRHRDNIINLVNFGFISLAVGAVMSQIPFIFLPLIFMCRVRPSIGDESAYVKINLGEYISL